MSTTISYPGSYLVNTDSSFVKSLKTFIPLIKVTLKTVKVQSESLAHVLPFVALRGYVPKLRQNDR